MDRYLCVCVSMCACVRAGLALDDLSGSVDSKEIWNTRSTGIGNHVGF